MEQKKKINVLNELVVSETIKSLDKGEKMYLIDLISKSRLNDNNELITLVNGEDTKTIKAYMNKYVAIDIVNDISNNEFKKLIQLAQNECFKMKVKRVDKTSELNSYQVEIANNSILQFTKALTKAILMQNKLTLVEIGGNYRAISIDKFNQIKLEAHKQMWEKIKLDCEL